MAKVPVFTAEPNRMTVVEACRWCGAEVDFFRALVIEGVFEPRGQLDDEWWLEPDELTVLRKAARLHRDLGVNVPGIALALELLQELEHLQQRGLARYGKWYIG